MIAWMQTLRGRTIAVMALGVLLSHVIGLAIYLASNASSLSHVREQLVVERLATAAKLLERLPAERRTEIVAELSEPDFRLRLGQSSRVAEADAQEDDTYFIRTSLALALRVPLLGQVLADYEPANRGPASVDVNAHPPRAILAERVDKWFRFREDLFVSFQLSDGSWLNAGVRGGPLVAFFNPGLVWSLGLMVLAVLALTAWAVARPLAGLKQFARAAEALGVDVEHTPALDEGGPLEIRRTARAFNRMRDRIQTLVEDRTRMLAAMSHDLRTPLTRIRLRAEYFDDETERRKMLRDVADMEQIVAATLRFLHDGVYGEPREEVDLVSMLIELCLDLELDPPEFRLQGGRRIRYACAPVAMRRALGNLLDNARKYGGEVEVRAERRPDELWVEIEDGGPGIPPEEYENVFRPFYRLEASRNRDSGGCGLGLSIARSVIRGHGGDIELDRAPRGGLRVRVILPAV